MDLNEFSIACKLIKMKLTGYEVPPQLPPSMLAAPAMGGVAMMPQPQMGMAGGMMMSQPIMQQGSDCIQCCRYNNVVLYQYLLPLNDADWPCKSRRTKSIECHPSCPVPHLTIAFSL